MSYQLFSNDQGLREFADDRRRQLLNEAEAERQSSHLASKADRIPPAQALIVIAFALIGFIGAALALA